MYADTKNTQMFYSSLKEVYGPRQVSTAPIKDIEGELLTDKQDIDKRFAEHFEQLLNRPSAIDPEAINEIPARKVNNQLDELPTVSEVFKSN